MMDTRDADADAARQDATGHDVQSAGAAVEPDAPPSAPAIGEGSRGERFASLAAGFVALGGHVLAGDTHALDERALRAAQSLRASHPAVGSAMRDLSGVGSTVVLTLVVALAAGYLVLVRRRTTAALVVVSSLSGAWLVGVMKGAFGRVRPDSQFAELVVHGLSYPSGHATMSAAVFLTLGALLANTRARRRERAYVLAGAVLLATLVGASRVALGVHWLTDVLGGWAFGSAWAMLWLLVARRLRDA
jgi:undecaprenyl-diphosphatase